MDLGACWTGESADQLPVKTESAILFAPAGELVPQALSQLEKGGTLAVAGIHLSDIPALNYQESLFFERDLRSVTANTREDGRELLREAAEIPIRPRTVEYALADANRALLDLKQDGINGTGLLVVCGLALAFVVALRYLRRGSGAYRVLAGTAAVFVLAWTLTAQVYAAEGERDLSTRVAKNLPSPFDWVEEETGGKSVVVVGQQVADPTNVWLTEFFNPSIRKMWSLDGTAPGPGPILTPDLVAADGTLTPPPGTDYALGINGVELQAPIVERRGTTTLYRLDGGPLKLGSAVTGLYSDGWIGDRDGNGVAEAAYTRYDVSRDGPGFALVKLSRVAWCGGDVPGKAIVKIGPVAIGEDRQPTLNEVTETQVKTVHQCVTTPFLLPAPNVPWRVEVTIEPTFSPHDLDPENSDRRQLGATMDVGFQPLFGG